jgi:hypothetical protein
MLYSVSNKYKDGYVEDFISTNPNIDQDNIVGSIVFPFKYKTKSILRPGIAIIQGKKYITPGWIPCHPDTTISDIIWTAEISKQEKVKEIDTWRFKSSSGDGEYVTKRNGFKYTCNCPGVWRAKDRECKHIKEVKSKYL